MLHVRPKQRFKSTVTVEGIGKNGVVGRDIDEGITRVQVNQGEANELPPVTAMVEAEGEPGGEA